MGCFIKGISGNVLRIELLPYHTYGVPNYQRIGLKYLLQGLISPSEKRMEELRKIFVSYGLETRIGAE